jgi:hypothetical protein
MEKLSAGKCHGEPFSRDTKPIPIPIPQEEAVMSAFGGKADIDVKRLHFGF